MSLPLPAWLNDVPAEIRPIERKKFLLRLAALYATPNGNLPALSAALGLNKNTLSIMAVRDGRLSPDMTLAIEALVGGDKIPRSLLNPEIYPSLLLQE